MRIFCDNLPVLHLIASGVDASIKQKIDLQPWEASFQNARHAVDAPQVVIEAFGCNLPERYLAGLLAASQQPIILNLEYLTAESWITDFHGKPSPQAHGIPKYFFFPGFQDQTGGILIDPIPAPALTRSHEQPPEDLQATWSQLRPDAKRISVFCYPNAPLEQWLQDLGALGEPIDILLTDSHADRLKTHATTEMPLPASLKVFSLPFVSQDHYDWLLSQCDLNIVRGEDSFVRAQLAGKPFIWHIYPQEDYAHEAKLEAFLALYLEEASKDLQKACRQAMHWEMPSNWFSQIQMWESHSQSWRQQLLKKQGDGGLAARLMGFVA